MNIEEFYEANEARRQSAEVEFGSAWTDAVANEYELSWVQDTGELYLMLGPEAVAHTDMVGDTYSYDEPISGLIVKIMGTYSPLDKVEMILQGWTDAIS